MLEGRSALSTNLDPILGRLNRDFKMLQFWWVRGAGVKIPLKKTLPSFHDLGWLLNEKLDDNSWSDVDIVLHVVVTFVTRLN